MVFLVIQKYEPRYVSYDSEQTMSILGIYTCEAMAKERLEKESVREHNRKNTSSSLFIVQIEMDVDVDVDLIET